MKQVLLLFLVLSSCAQAASEACEKKVSHVANHLEISAHFSAAQANDGVDFAARYFPWQLAFALEGAMRCGPVHTKVAPHVTTALRFCEQKALGEDSKDWKISKMSIFVAIKHMGIALRIEGEADPETFQTLFPPYTVTSEGAVEVPLENPHEYFAIGKAPKIFKKKDRSSGLLFSDPFKNGVLHVGLDHSSLPDGNWNLFGPDFVNRECRTGFSQ